MVALILGLGEQREHDAGSDGVDEARGALLGDTQPTRFDGVRGRIEPFPNVPVLRGTLAL